MRQTVEVKVTLTFEANNVINPEGMAQIIENVQNALEHWEWNGALCPRQIGGYTVSIEVDIE